MGWPSKLVLVRHAESEGNLRSVDERAVFEMSTADYPLTDKGRRQAEITGEFLKRRFEKFDRYYASYYRRSRETMEIMFPEAKIYEDPRLAESQRGIFHTMTSQELRDHYPHELRRKDREGLYHYRPPGGENWPDVELRIHSFLGTLARDYEGERVVMVVHGHWLILFNRLIEHFSIAEAVRQYKEGEVAANASVTVYDLLTVSKKTRLIRTHDRVVPWRGMLKEESKTTLA